MLAQGADNVIGQGIAFVDPAADFADVALLALGLGLGLDVVLVEGIAHGLPVGNDPGFGDGADEHAVGVQIHHRLHLQAHEGVDVAGQEPQAVVRAQLIHAGELVHSAAALEAEGLEHGEGSGHIQAVDVHLAGLLDDVVGIVCLVDGDSDAVGGVGHLGDGVDNQAIVPGAVVGGHHIQAVADVKEGIEVIFVGSGILTGQVVLAQLLGQSLHLGGAVLAEGGEQLHGGVGEGQVLAALEHLAHDLGSQRCPGAVLHQGHGAVLEVPLGQVMDILLHEGEDVGIIGGGGQHQLAVTEGILHSLCHVAAGQVVDNHLGAALGLELLCQQLHSGLGVAIDRGVSDDDALALHPVGRPDIIQVQVVAQVLREHGTMQGADGGDVQTRSLLQQSLHLGAILAHDADVVAAGFVVPLLLHIQCAELAEAVSGEEDLVAGIVSDDDFRPVDHGSGDEGQGVLAQHQGVALAHHQAAVGIIIAEELAHHAEGLGRGDHGGLRIDFQEIGNVGGVVRLHVLHHQIVRLAALEDGFDVVQPLVGEVAVHGVHDGHLFVQNDIRVVGHAVGHHILALKQVHLVVVDADVTDIVGNGHSTCLLLWIMA